MNTAQLPPEVTDGDIQRMLRAESHEHVEKILDSMSDEDFVAFISRLIEWSKRRRRGQREPSEKYEYAIA